MSTVISSDTSGAQSLAYLPSSPTEDDLGVHYSRSEATLVSREASRTSSDDTKGKRRALEHVSEGTSDADSTQEFGRSESYPPINDEEADTRRVEENLRRWELAERQRRKAVRTSLNTAPNSVVGTISRRASLIWSKQRPQSPPSQNLGQHTVLKGSDSMDVLPLEPFQTDHAMSPNATAPSSPVASPLNPFIHPAELSSPFDDRHQESAVMKPSPDPPRPSRLSSNGFLDVPSPGRRKPHPPRPLGLPVPRTPPPPDGTVTAEHPQAMPHPVIVPPESDLDRLEEPPARWWHDWLCGCGEGPDRGGDNQAGRTNPFE